MPIFEYECLDCEQPFEFFQLRTDSQAECPSCKGARVQRLISLCAVSSEQSRSSNLKAAHQRAASKRTDKARAEHSSHHGHFEDTATASKGSE